MQKINIYLDDERNPRRDDWIVVRNYSEFEKILNSVDVVDEISFDHDLGEEKTGYDCLKLLVEKDIASDGKLLNENFKYNFHTANICGKINMETYIKCYLKNRWLYEVTIRIHIWYYSNWIWWN